MGIRRKDETSNLKTENWDEESEQIRLNPTISEQIRVIEKFFCGRRRIRQASAPLLHRDSMNEQTRSRKRDEELDRIMAGQNHNGNEAEPSPHDSVLFILFRMGTEPGKKRLLKYVPKIACGKGRVLYPRPRLGEGPRARKVTATPRKPASIENGGWIE